MNVLIDREIISATALMETLAGRRIALEMSRGGALRTHPHRSGENSSAILTAHSAMRVSPAAANRKTGSMSVWKSGTAMDLPPLPAPSWLRLAFLCNDGMALHFRHNPRRFFHSLTICRMQNLLIGQTIRRAHQFLPAETPGLESGAIL